MVVWGGGTRAGSGWHQERFNPPFLVCVGFLVLQRSLARVLGGGVVQKQVEVQVQGGGRERFQRCGMLHHAPVLQLGPMLALVVEPKAYVARGWDGTGAGSGSKHPAVTVLGGVKFLVLKPSCGNMHTWSLCLRWLWGRAVQEQVQVQVQDVWLAV